MRIGDIDMSGLTRSARQSMIATHNVERVRDFMETYLGCSAREVAYGLDLSYDQAKRSVDRIRKEWLGR
jgi:hypothetical protein